MKRIISSVSCCTRSKRPRLEPPLSFINRPVSPIVVSASHVYNYMINDPLIDWLRLRSRTGTRLSPAYSHSRDGFTEFIQAKGIEFEDKLIKYINEHKIVVETVGDYITDETCNKTIDLMKQGAPVLHSAPVRNPRNNTQGIIDLLVRSDCIKFLVEEAPLNEQEEKVTAPNLNGRYHYVVIDIKFSTLPLRSDGKHLLNSGGYPAYKAQTYIYTQAVGHIQGYTAPHAFIMGRRWNYTKKDVKHDNYTCLNRLGKIDYAGIDKEYKERTKKAIQWVRDVKQYGAEWSVDPPSRMELYPNMCVDSGVWNSEKQKIADNIGEITTVWNVGIKHRNKALLKDITSWRDRRCTTENLEINGVRTNIIDRIMDINRQSRDKMWPQLIRNNTNDWKNSTNEVFVDFETLADIFSDFDHLPNQDSTDIIFMIGVGWEENGNWCYRNYICNRATYSEEYRIMDEFMQFLKNRGNPKVNFWCAEDRFWNIAECRQFDIACKTKDIERKDNISDNWKIEKWCDLYHVFQSEPIVVKDCFKFSLKHIAKAMKKHGMISISLDTDCTSGLTAMIKASKCYDVSDDPANCGTMRDIARYNEFDCKVLWEIVTYLRNNHC